MSMKNQSGIALAVSLILLLVVTLIAVSALNVSKRDRQISSNLKRSALIMRGGEQRVNESMTDASLISSTTSRSLTIQTNADTGVSTSGKVEFKGVGEPPKSIKTLLGSKNIGAASGIQVFFYDVSVTAKDQSTSAASELNIGFLIPAPKSVTD